MKPCFIWTWNHGYLNIQSKTKIWLKYNLALNLKYQVSGFEIPINFAYVNGNAAPLTPPTSSSAALNNVRQFTQDAVRFKKFSFYFLRNLLCCHKLAKVRTDKNVVKWITDFRLLLVDIRLLAACDELLVKFKVGLDICVKKSFMSCLVGKIGHPNCRSAPIFWRASEYMKHCPFDWW